MTTKRLSSATFRNNLRQQTAADRRKPPAPQTKREIGRLYHKRCRRWVRIDALSAHRQSCVRIQP